MAESTVIYALRRKRGELMGEIKDLEALAKARRAKLAHIDETIRLFDPTIDPKAITPRRRYHRSGYFKAGELSRLVLEFLRDRPEPATAREIVTAVMRARGHDVEAKSLREAITDMTLNLLRGMARRGAVVRTYDGRNTFWAPANGEAGSAR
ncbi:MAG: hypothetical protein ACREHV_00595 [Rhizomicrobium sp.]